jgi:large subunit ribosomal protein L24
MSKWIRKGDQVKVIAGNEKGKQGEVLARIEERVLIKGVNIRKKHLKKTQESQGGRIVEMEVPIHISNVVLSDKEGNPLKIRVQIAAKGKERQLVYKEKNTSDVTVYRSLKKSG